MFFRTTRPRDHETTRLRDHETTRLRVGRCPLGWICWSPSGSVLTAHYSLLTTHLLPKAVPVGPDMVEPFRLTGQSLVDSLTCGLVVSCPLSFVLRPKTPKVRSILQTFGKNIKSSQYTANFSAIYQLRKR